MRLPSWKHWVIAQALVRARTQWQDAGALPVRIDTVSLTPQGPRYASFDAVSM
jgi:hypothetical protein